MTLLSFGLEEYPYWQGVVHTIAALYIPICLVLWKMYKRVDKELEGRQTETQKQPSQMLPQLLDYEIALVCGTELSDIFPGLYDGTVDLDNASERLVGYNGSMTEDHNWEDFVACIGEYKTWE